MSVDADAVERVQGFVAAVRRAGVPVAPDRVHGLLRALDELGPGGLYWAGRLTLCGGHEDIERYDAVWRALVQPEPAGHGRLLVPLTRRVSAPPPAGGSESRERSDRAEGRLPEGSEFRASVASASVIAGREVAVAARASADEVLRHRDLADLTGPERDEVRRLLALLAPAAPLRATRRLRRAPAGRVDPHRTLRATLRGLGEPARLARRRPGRRPRRLVLLLDVSGSMAPYADALLRFAHAAVRVRPAATEVFTIGTRLTRVTAALRHPDPEVAVARAGAQVPDWRGGTRLGDTLTGYLRAFGHRGMARRAVVVVCSDGWEGGDAAELGGAVAWLGRLAHRVVWVSPHAGRPGFAPTAAGLAAALPHVDHLVAGHSLAALAELADVVRHC